MTSIAVSSYQSQQVMKLALPCSSHHSPKIAYSNSHTSHHNQLISFVEPFPFSFLRPFASYQVLLLISTQNQQAFSFSLCQTYFLAHLPNQVSIEANQSTSYSILLHDLLIFI